MDFTLKIVGVYGRELADKFTSWDNEIAIDVLMSDRAKWDYLARILGRFIDDTSRSLAEIGFSQRPDCKHDEFARGASILDNLLARPYPFTDIAIAAKHAQLLREIATEEYDAQEIKVQGL